MGSNYENNLSTCGIRLCKPSLDTAMAGVKGCPLDEIMHRVIIIVIFSSAMATFVDKLAHSLVSHSFDVHLFILLHLISMKIRENYT